MMDEKKYSVLIGDYRVYVVGQAVMRDDYRYRRGETGAVKYGAEWKRIVEKKPFMYSNMVFTEIDERG